ncbi:hypothetical protein [Catalinimonas niigatensis]|uniref:hypothetical protein n=1 Tax=Catalinimonas niigatensis TaxID=1397264 RepID=UPI002665044C|nr:hypothetical protein [Catalinimonas niigatensis]WPP49067.1 hypothetical protein PZB72_20580 [Catalinimonas niigatensis]
MIIIKHSLFLFMALMLLQCNTEKASVYREQTSGEAVPLAFNKIDTTAQVIAYTNPLEVNHQGGHLQGIQWMEKDERTYAVITGSSGTYSYYAVMRLGDENKVISINKILDKPYKHAGGFQIYDNSYMAIGVEDNEARNTSKVHIYKINDPEQPPREPVAVIERTGAYERATAGCVGIMMIDHKILLVVGDWNSRHLDFYLSHALSSETKSLTFEKIYTIRVADTDREEWVNKEWLAYQNINLIRDQKNKLYLVGLARNEQQQDIADLFEIETKDLKTFRLIKVATRQFEAEGGTNFQWAAGVYYDSTAAHMRIISSTDHLDKTAVLNQFR